MAVLAYSTLILLFVPSIQAGSFQTECESYAGRSLFYSDSFCYTKEKSPYCGLFPNGEIVGQAMETLWDVLGQELNDDLDNIEYQTSNLRAPFGPGQSIQIVGSGIQTPGAEYTRYGFNLGFFELSIMFNHAASSTSVYVKEGHELTAHTNMISFGPDEEVTFEFVVDDNHRMQIYANGAVLLGNLTAPANLSSIGTWGAFDVQSINVGQRFYGPYKDCPRIGLQKENPLYGEWMWTDTSEMFQPSGTLEWEVGQPDNAASEESCACLHLASKVLRDIFCDDVAERICRYPTPPETPATPAAPAEGGYQNCLAGQGLQEPLLLGKGERCLQVGAVKTNWNDAMDHCNSLGGHLFHIYNMHDYIQIVEWFKKLREQGLTFDAFVGYKKESAWTPSMPLSLVVWMKDKETSAQMQLTDLPGFDFIIESPYTDPMNIYGFFGTCGSEMPFERTNCDDPMGPLGFYMKEGWTRDAVAVCQYRPLSSNKSFKGKRNKKSEGSSYASITGAKDATACASQCAQELQCQGFNVVESGDTVNCDFVSEGASHRYSEGIIYYEKHSIQA